ncbi:hypothetical protein GCM10008111_06770 [Alishewanella tabrizica]|uniref:Uncharacterized protein n=2 Tax=Alishewanella tabrizica TaxID=671278 RepID=A0ABQ2WF66_9ALTE|nr:hypothetical protein GCM10008111_06770 [Alishewanella tabrizica]
MQIKYRQNLSYKAERLQNLYNNIPHEDQSTQLDELRQLCHQLAGSGAIYGFPEISRLAQVLNNLLKSTEHTSFLTIKLSLSELLLELEHVKALPSSISHQQADIVESSSTKRKIVIADDDADLLNFLSDTLEKAGYEVIAVQDIRLLADTVAKHNPLILLCDMAFPEGDTAGAEYLIQVRQQQGVTFPVLFISAHDNFTSRLAAIRAGSSHFLAKPIDSDKLCQLLGSLYQKSEQDPYRVMLIDDDHDVLRFYRQTLQMAGYKVLCCQKPEYALTLMLKHQPELVLIDLHMPDCHGLELGQIIRQHVELIDTPLVFMSADESLDEKMAAVRLAGDEFVHKPIAPWRLLMIVEARVKRSRLLHQQKRKLMRQPELVQHLDTLTALPTLWQLHKDIESMQHQKIPFYLLKLDLNKFHLVNDVYGHQTGDLLLQTVAWKLMQQLDTKDQLYRQNGDEFWLLLQNTSQTTAQRLAENLLISLTQSTGTLISELNLSASVGITSSDAFSESSELMIQQANIALHQAKEKQSYQIQFFNSTMQTDLSKRYQLQQSIKQALQQHEFYPVFQPIVTKDNQLYSVELLCRWQHKFQGPVSPEVFIPMLEEEGLIQQLTWQMLKEGLKHLQTWRLQQPHLKLSVNFSASDFTNPELPSELMQLLTENQLPAQALILEITESVLLENSTRLNQQLRQLKMLGFTIALDDFGTGYSSLSYLDYYPVDILKIDRSFINKLDNAKAKRLTLAIIHLAHELQLHITAEGIETAEQLQLLCAEHCQHFQGYFFSKPLSAADLLRSKWFTQPLTTSVHQPLPER